LVEVARRHGVLLVEDVAYRELGFDGARRTSLWSIGPDVVVQLGTFSKTFAPGFRMGWLAGPEPLVAQAMVAKQVTDQCTGALGQRLVEAYGRSWGLDAQTVAARHLYGERCRLLLDAFSRHLPPGVSWTRPAGGFFSWVTAPEGVDTTELRDRGLAEGVGFVPGRPFYPDGRGGNQIRVSFSRAAEDTIEEGSRRLGSLLARAMEAAA
ncbi:MAG: aminotransferase class I/II-fold pyridoxal phosphate-dependent enzyme, partial [Acidimicrobiales bacterium]